MRKDGQIIGSFSISTNIPKDWQIREEEVWDRRSGPPGCAPESVKSALNRELSWAIAKETGLVYEGGSGECRVVFDFTPGTPEVRLEQTPIFIFGRYMKHVPGLSQSRWLCAECNGAGCPSCSGKGKNYESVEERIGEPAKDAAGAKGYVMHASGREDVDATNTAGRAFVLELDGPSKRGIDLAELQQAIGKSKEVSVKDLLFVARKDVELITESHFDKTYEARVSLGRDVVEADLAAVKGLEGSALLQQTPTRVAHRRADIVRRRIVKHVEAADERGREVTLVIKAEAGTYIKEFVSGDSGRTKPSVAQALGTSAICTELEVVGIDDGFIDLCLQAGKNPRS